MRKQSNRKIRSVSGKDPVLSIEAYEEWKAKQISGKERSFPFKIIKAICENTIKSVKEGKKPFSWSRMNEENELSRNWSRKYRESLIQAGFIEVLYKDRNGSPVIVATKKALKLYLDSVEKLNEALGELV